VVAARNTSSAADGDVVQASRLPPSAKPTENL
jgi:hypothetical protein